MTNRHVKRLSKRGHAWCGGCDRKKVGHTTKCPICGHINGRTNRDKK